MTEKQPEALRLADALDGACNGPLDFKHKAAAELRRLHEVNTELVEALKEAAYEIQDWGSYASEYFQQKHNLAGSVAAVHAAILKATGEQ